jgi:flagellar FlgN protein
MSTSLPELEAVLKQMLIEHRRLLAQLDLQQAAMKKFDVRGMSSSAHQQELSRTRLVSLDAQRRVLATRLAAEFRIPGEVTLAGLANLNPARASGLLQLRRDMRETIDAVRERTNVSSRLAAAVIGHLNTTLRIFAGALQKAGLYTKQGIPRLASRIGVMEAIG